MPRHPARHRLTRLLPWALSGVLAAVAGIAVGHLVAGLLDPASSPVLAVGSTVIDATPTPVKEWAVARFGTHDKPILLGSVTVVTLLAAAAAGVLARRRTWPGIAFVLLLTGLATLAAVLRPVATPVDAVPGGVAAVVGRRRPDRPGDRPAGRDEPPTRRRHRRLLGRSAAGDRAPHGARQPPHLPAGRGAVTLGAAGAAAVGQRLSTAGGPSSTALPRPVEAAPPLPPGLERRSGASRPLRTPQRDVLPRRHRTSPCPGSTPTGGR